MNKTIYFLIILAMIMPAQAVVSTTNAATGVDTDSVTFNGNLAGVGVSASYYFEYGANSAVLNYKTTTRTSTGGAVAETHNGFPLMAGKTYYYRLHASEGASVSNGAVQAFALTATSPITGYNFSEHFDELVATDLNITQMSEVAVTPYTDIMGGIFWGIVFAGIFGIIWLRQEDVTIPSILGLIIGISIWSYMPATWIQAANALMVVSIFGVIYSIAKTK